MKAYKVYEYQEFTRSTDLKSNLNIGKRANIIKWFETWAPDTEYEISDDLKIIVNGDLYLEGTNITKLPNNMLTVRGNLYISNTNITKLPNNLTVGGLKYIIY